MSFEMNGVSCDQSGEERAGQAGWAEWIPWITDLSLSPDGRILVERRAPGQEGTARVDVFGTEGAYVGTLPPDFPFPELWRGPDEIVRLEFDELRVPYVVVYGIERGAGLQEPPEGRE